MNSARGRGARGLSAAALLPGLPQLLRGQHLAGLSLMALGLSMLAVLAFGFDRVLTTFTTGRVDHWIALLTLAGTLGVAWWLSAVWGRGRREDEIGGASGWAIAWREFKKNRPAVLGLYLMVALYLVTLLAPYLTSYDPTEIVEDIISVRHLAPSPDHPMGTDKYGRDVYARILYGARISLSIGFIAVAISITLGTSVGAVSGYFGGAVDTVLMRFVDTLISFPRLVLLITVIALFQPSILVVVIVLGLTLWPSTARIVRSEVLSLREREFIEAARALGLGSPRIILRHIIPNVMGPVIVAATLGLGNIILIEAGLSFLGLSVPPPTPTWGVIINDGREFLLEAWWVSTFPGLAIVFTVVAFNLIGDGLRDALDPRMRMRT